MKRLAYASSLVLSVIVLLAAWTPGQVPAEKKDEPLMVFLVRHAEKIDQSRNPALTEAGHRRAKALAETLQGAKIDHVHSTDFLRTRDTAAPLAKKLGLKVNLYDPRDLPSLVKSIGRSGGRHLVVGHSNTTPKVVELLGGDPGKPFDEMNEFDRLYLVSRDKEGKVTTVLLRFGEAIKPGPQTR